LIYATAHTMLNCKLNHERGYRLPGFLYARLHTVLLFDEKADKNPFCSFSGIGFGCIDSCREMSSAFGNTKYSDENRPLVCITDRQTWKTWGARALRYMQSEWKIATRSSARPAKNATDCNQWRPSESNNRIHGLPNPVEIVCTYVHLRE